MALQVELVGEKVVLLADEQFLLVGEAVLALLHLLLDLLQVGYQEQVGLLQRMEDACQLLRLLEVHLLLGGLLRKVVVQQRVVVVWVKRGRVERIYLFLALPAFVL